MQQTRLFNLFSTLNNRLNVFFINPWRRISLIIMSFFFGFFSATGIITTAGQVAQWDVTVSIVLLLLTELANLFIYRSNLKKSFWIGILNSFKIGFAYSLYLQALQLNT